MTENVNQVIENAEVNVTDIPMEPEVEGSATVAVVAIVAAAGALLAAGVGLYKLGKYARKRYQEHKAQKEMDTRFENGDAEESVQIDDSETVKWDE